MKETISLQGRELTPADVDFVRQLITENPNWSRRQLSIALSTAWQWRNAKGALKDMACRTLLVKLHERELITLPPRRQAPTRRMVKRDVPDIAHDTAPIENSLADLRPLRVIAIQGQCEAEPLYRCLLSRYHYLGYTSTVGENMKYLILDRENRPLACLLYGSSAWSCAARDEFIGWGLATRKRNLQLTTNNTRFLILPWVKIPHLASHILSLVARRISQDWAARYGHGLCMLETFVDTTRFSGTCYRAANWQPVGHTRGRSRNDRYTQIKVPIKSVWIYPLNADYRKQLHS